VSGPLDVAADRRDKERFVVWRGGCICGDLLERNQVSRGECH